jgi:pimeloyl-ACP methyl ester carboxylesterase
METRASYVRSRDGARIAYTVSGSGPALAILQIPSLSHIELYPHQAGAAEFLRSIGAGRTLIRLDFRGTGMSERQPTDHSPDALTGDLEAVVDACGIASLDIYAAGVRVSPALDFALRRPAGVNRIVLADPFTPRPLSNGTPGIPGFLGLMQANYAFFIETMAQRLSRRSPADVPDLIRYMHRCTDQRNQVAELRASMFEADWEAATSVPHPVLVLDRAGVSVAPAGQVAAFAGRFPAGRYVPLPETADVPPFGTLTCFSRPSTSSSAPWRERPRPRPPPGSRLGSAKCCGCSP